MSYREWAESYLSSDCTYHKVRVDLWGKLCALRAANADVPLTNREWCTIRSYLCARNEDVSREAAFASDNIVVGSVTSMDSRVQTPV